MRLVKFLSPLLDIICGISILIGFFVLPFIDVFGYFSALGSKSSAYKFVAYLTNPKNNNGDFQFIASVAILYIFVGIGLILILRGLIGFFVHKKRITIFSALRKIIIALIFYGIIPSLILFNFYAIVLNYTGSITLKGEIFTFGYTLSIASPLTGLYVMFLASVAGGILAIFKAITRVFKKVSPHG